MGGRVKYKASVKPKNTISARKLGTRSPPPVNSVFQIAPANTPGLDKSSIAWLSVLSVLAVASAILILWLLFRGKCGRRKTTRKDGSGHRYHPSLEIKDGRNEFEAWNRNPGRKGTVESISSLAPLTAAAVKPAGVVHPGNPVVIEDVPLTPVYGRKGRYYSGLGDSLKRISQIGKAC